MRILDRYIAKKFLSNILFSILAFIVIFLIVDLVEKLSDYIDRETPLVVLVQYYIYFIPEVITLAMPLSMLLATLFSVGQLSKYNEILAMKASGISLYRIMAPILLLSLLVSIFMIYFVEMVVPRANTERAEIKGRYIDRQSRYVSARISNLYFHDDLGRRIFIGYYNSSDQLARTISVLMFDDANIYIRHRIDARTMRWQDGQWVLEHAWERYFNGQLDSVIFHDEHTLSGFSYVPDELGAVQKDPLEMNYGELKKFIDDVKRNGGDPNQWLVDLYLKISFPFANFIIVLFGAPLAAVRARSAGAAGIALSLIFVFLYFLGVKAGQTFGQTGAMHPMLAAWLGNIAFTVGGLFIFWRAPK